MFARSFASSFASRSLSPQCPKSFHSPRVQFSSPAWRQFTSSAVRAKKGAAKPKQPATPNAASRGKASVPPEDSLKFAGRRAEGFGKLERKVAKEGEVVLFKAPSHRTYILSAYGLATFCFGYSLYNSNIVFRDPIVPLPVWQKALFGGICMMMSAMGTVFAFRTGRLINHVKAISDNGKTYVRFNVRHMMPLRKPYEFDVLPRQIAFSRHLVISAGSHSTLSAQQNVRPSDVSFFKKPGKKISVMLWRVFCSVRQIFTQEDMILMEVQGQKGAFRMDSAGFVSEDFLAIGNPVSIKRY